MLKKRLLPFVLLLCLLTIAGCSTDQTTEGKQENNTSLLSDPYTDEQFLLGTYVRIRIYDEGKEDVLKPAFDRVKELGDKSRSIKAAPKLMKSINKRGIKPVKVSDDVYRLLKRAYEYSEDSHGGFDMAIGPITQLWRIGFDDARKPSQAEIDEALKLVDYHKVNSMMKKRLFTCKKKA